MGRPREFLEDEVIAAAQLAFWREGYGATSIPDLMEATDLERGSLYKAFGDKHSLFERALDAYLRSGRAAMAQTLESADRPLVKLRKWLTQVAAVCSSANGGPGCLAVNAMVELGPTDAAVRNRLRRHWALVERTLEKTLHEGQRRGEIRDDVAAGDLARLLVRTIAGIAAFSRHGNSANITDTILLLLTCGS